MPLRRALVAIAFAAGLGVAAQGPVQAQTPAPSSPGVERPPVGPAQGLDADAAKPLDRPAERPVGPEPHRLAGYLGPDGVPDAIAILPPSPPPASQVQALDEAIYVQTRKLDGTARWALAAQDAIQTPDAFEDDLSCAVGVRLDPASTPALLRLMSRMGADAGAIVNRAKDHYRRPRPFVGNALPICVERTAALAASPSYPSGHSTFGWAAGLILAEIEPDRATPILARARAFGESRAVCGVHYASDVEAGRTTGAALVAALHASPEFQADLDAASRELTGLRTRGPALAGAASAASDEAAAHTPWAP